MKMRLYPQETKIHRINNNTIINWKTTQLCNDIFTMPLETTYITTESEIPLHFYGVFQRIVDLWNVVRGTSPTGPNADPCPLPNYKNGNVYANDGKLLALSTNYLGRINQRIINSNIDNTIQMLFMSNEVGNNYTKYWNFNIDDYEQQEKEFSTEYELCSQLAKQFIQVYGDGLKFLNYMYGIEYDPLDNYNGTEIITYSDFVTDYLNGKNLTRSYSNLKNTHTPTNYTNTTTQKMSTNMTTTRGMSNINKGVGYDSNSWRNQEYDQNNETTREYGNADANKVTTTNIESGSYNDTTTGGYKDSTTGTDKTTEHSHTITTEKSGNLGVTTSCQMKTAEVEFWSNPNNIEIGVLYSMLDRLIISKIY